MFSSARNDSIKATRMAEEYTNNIGANAEPFPKADVLERFLAKFIDFLVMGAFFVFPAIIGPLAGITYILISDGLMGGHSIGKRIVGIRAVAMDTREPCDFKRSIIRNSPFAILIIVWYIVSWIPYLGKVLFLAATLAVIGFEMLLIYTDERGARFGDRLAETVVIGRE